MCEYYGLPLALIFEELIEIEKPKNKEQEQGLSTASYGLFRSIMASSAACATCGGLRPPPVLGGSGSAPPPPKGA